MKKKQKNMVISMFRFIFILSLSKNPPHSLQFVLLPTIHPFLTTIFTILFSSHMIKVQTDLTERAIALMGLQDGENAYILDIGTGSGLSGEVLTEHGFQWVGTDISKSMLGVALERGVEGDVVCSDMGQGLIFRPGSFDGCISISALQWLCNADATDHIPQRRLKRFFTTLYSGLVQGARAVFQFYPESPDHLAMIQYAALQAGFNGGLVVDYPNSTRAKKYFLCLFAGESKDPNKKNILPKGLTGMENDEIDYGSDGGDDDGDSDDDSDDNKTITVLSKIDKRKHGKRPGGNQQKGESRRDWLKKKKEKMRSQGLEVPHDSKRTGRLPRVKF
jgi:18S rRNA (guanine1575-N7)-methyltransferase